jgi:hypothetical protein
VHKSDRLETLVAHQNVLLSKVCFQNGRKCGNPIKFQ